jgi:hypothetical protein
MEVGLLSTELRKAPPREEYGLEQSTEHVEAQTLDEVET